MRDQLSAGSFYLIVCVVDTGDEVYFTGNGRFLAVLLLSWLVRGLVAEMPEHLPEAGEDVLGERVPIVGDLIVQITADPLAVRLEVIAVQRGHRVRPRNVSLVEGMPVDHQRPSVDIADHGQAIGIGKALRIVAVHQNFVLWQWVNRVTSLLINHHSDLKDEHSGPSQGF